MYVPSVVNLPSRVSVRATIFCLALIVGSFAANRVDAAELRIRTTVVAAGDATDATIAFTSQGSEVAGLQCDLVYDEDIFIVAITPGDAGPSAGKGVQVSLLPDGTIRVITAGFNQTVMPDGTFVNLRVLVSPSAQPGPHTLRCDNAVATTPSGEQIEIDVRQGRIVAIPSK
jgi:hypothetical protein